MSPGFRQWWGVVLLAACSRSAPPARASAGADLQLKNVSIRTYSEGILKAVTTADGLDVFQQLGQAGDFVAVDAGIRVVRDGTWVTSTRITGNTLSGHLMGHDVAVFGAKEVRGGSPRVNVERALRPNAHASSDAGVWLSQPGLQLTGEGFEMELESEYARFWGTTSVFQPDNK
jgi:hypothetical protein